MKKVIGIDLGTTKACVAVMEGGRPHVIASADGERTIPSVAAFSPDGQGWCVGRRAAQLAGITPENTVAAAARLLGQDFKSPETQETRRFQPYRLVEGPGGAVQIQIAENVHSPAEVVAFVIRGLKAAAEDYLGEAVDEAVITVPAWSHHAQRQAIKDACLIAGLKVTRLIAGSTAAGLTYGLENAGQNQFVAVCDLGGGTLDITILEAADGLFQVRAVGGDTCLGGEDFNQRIVGWLIDEFQRRTGIALAPDPMALQHLKAAAERAKCELSTSQQAEIALSFLTVDPSGPRHLDTVLTRRKHDELTVALLQRTIQACERCLADAGMRPEQVDEVLLVGGQTRAPNVREALRRVFGSAPRRAAHDGVAAMGAAIQAGITQGDVKDVVLLDVTPHTLGIETNDGTFTPLVERNSTIPTRKSRVFTTVAENQGRAAVHVLEGESDTVQHNRSLARFELASIPPEPRGVPQIEVTFEIDINDIVYVSATDQASGRSQGLVIHGVPPSEGTREPGSGRDTPGGLTLVDVIPQTLGIEGTGGTFTPLIARNTRLPTRASRAMTTTHDHQTRVAVHVLQGESDMAAYNKSLAKLEFTGIPPAPKGVPQIEVAFEIDVTGIVSVSGTDQATGRALGMAILPSDGLSQAEIGRLVAATRAPESEEKSRMDVVIRQLDGLAVNIARSVQALESKLSGAEQQRILAAIEAAKKAKARPDVTLDDLRHHLAEMEKAAQTIGQAMLRP